MKTLRMGLVSMAVLLVLAGCGGLFGGLFDDVGSGPKGLVTFYSNPRYDLATEAIYFAADLQYDDYERHSPVDIEYQIIDGSAVVHSGTAPADTFDERGRYWRTDEISVPLSRTTYLGKEITVFVDPEGKLLSEQWEMFENERRKTVTIR